MNYQRALLASIVWLSPSFEVVNWLPQIANHVPLD